MKPDSSDNRRDLYDFSYPFTKLVVIKEDCILGRHYHKLKDEFFVLLTGTGTATLGDDTPFEMTVMDGIFVPAGKLHTFTFSKGSIFLGFATKPHDPADEHRP